MKYFDKSDIKVFAGKVKELGLYSANKSAKDMKHLSKNLGELKDKLEKKYQEHKVAPFIKDKKTVSKTSSYKNDIIFKRLRMANKSELMGICESLKIKYFSGIPIDFLSKEYRQAAGHSIMNVSRSFHSLEYKRILIDVADKLKPGLKWTNFKMDDEFSEIDIEEKILEFVAYKFEKHLKKLPNNKKKELEDTLIKKLKGVGAKQATVNSTIAAITSGSIASILAAPVAAAIFTETLVSPLAAYGVAWITAGGITYPSVAVFGPTAAQVGMVGTGIGAAVAVPLLIATLGAPAYRKTIPATLRLIAIRKRCDAKL